MEASLYRHDQVLTRFPALLPFSEDESSKLLITAWFFLVTNCHAEASMSLPRVSSLEQQAHLPTQILLLEKTDTPITQDIPKDLGALCREPVSKTKHQYKRSAYGLPRWSGGSAPSSQCKGPGFNFWSGDQIPRYNYIYMGFPGGSDDKESACSVGDLGLTPGLRRSFGEGHGYPVQYSLLGEFHGQRSLTGYYPWDH